MVAKPLCVGKDGLYIRKEWLYEGLPTRGALGNVRSQDPSRVVVRRGNRLALAGAEMHMKVNQQFGVFTEVLSRI